MTQQLITLYYFIQTCFDPMTILKGNTIQQPAVEFRF